MSDNHPQPQKIIAQAKINLFLHITGKRNDGYHNLQSLITFANYGDEIKITPSDKFYFKIKGDFQNYLPKNDAYNSVVKSAQLLSRELNKDLNLTITLLKKIPIGAGLGGGSADAAATIKALLKFWEKTLPQQTLNKILLQLGADTPACYEAKTSYVEGIGDIITPLSGNNIFSNIPAILIYPDQFCSTQNIFGSYKEMHSPPITLPPSFLNTKDLYCFLKQQKNDLTTASCDMIPEIIDVLSITQKQTGCQIARMSGSGSACFGIFITEEESKRAAKNIKKEKPNWWVRPILIQ